MFYFHLLLFSLTDIFSPPAVAENELAGTTWRLVQCYYDNKLRAVNHRSTLTFAGDLRRITGNDGCSDITGSLISSGGNLRIGNITSPARKNCVGEQKLKVARVFITTLKGNPQLKLSGNYLMLYTGGSAKLVFSKIITEGEESTIIKRSYKVDAVLYKKGGKKYMKLYDYVTDSDIYLEKIKGFTYQPGYYYNIEMKTTIIGEEENARSSYELIRVVSKDKK